VTLSFELGQQNVHHLWLSTFPTNIWKLNMCDQMVIYYDFLYGHFFTSFFYHLTLNLNQGHQTGLDGKFGRNISNRFREKFNIKVFRWTDGQTDS
jgi:hypothetical protein